MAPPLNAAADAAPEDLPETRAALERAEAELRRLQGQFGELCGFVQRDVAALQQRSIADLTEQAAAWQQQVAGRDGIISELRQVIRGLQMNLAQERARRLAPKATRGGPPGRRFGG